MKVLITGANRGIGLALTRRYLSQGHHVLAACRNPDGARDLWELESDFGERCKIVPLDVSDDDSVAEAARTVGSEPLDIVINNAGVYPEKGAPFAEVSREGMVKAFNVNTVGPLRVAQHFVGHLEKADRPVLATVSSKVGSIEDNRSGGGYAYRVSKTAVNMLNKNLSLEFPDVTCVVLHPGWVETQMGGSGAPTSTEESANGLVEVIQGLKKEDSGSFIDFKGQRLPW